MSSKPEKLIEPRIELVPLSELHTDYILRWRSDPAVANWLCSPRPPTRDEHLAWLKTLGEKRREFIIAVKPENTPVGTIGLSQIDTCHRHAEYGILIGDASFRGRGLAQAASSLILDFAFRTLNLHRVYLRVLAQNESAIRLYERVGFKHEGVMRQHTFMAGKPCDVVMMGILEPEWTTRQ